MDWFPKCSTMESENGFAWREGVLLPVADTSDAFKNSILAPLQSAYLYEESRQSFKYMSAALFNNPALEEKYNSFRAKRKEAGYSEEELKETFGFLLFDDVNKAYALGGTGALSGNNTCTTLGDPSKGVYISMYSDCLDLNCWYHGKSGYIAIIRLTKGRVKKVSENYTQNFTAPTPGFDCHVSEQLPLVSAKTSSFLAFERTQYYMYELLDDGSSNKAAWPSAACPFAIVSFSYTDTKAILAIPQEKSDEKKKLFYYLPWRGQLQIGSQLYNVGLRATTTTLVTGKLPPVVKVDKAISMADLRQLLPQAVFETCFSSEVFLDGLYCSLCELIPSEIEETTALSLLLQEIKEKDLALPVPLNDGGFLILLHSSYFLTYDETSELLQGLFVFPQSQLVQKETKFGGTNAAISPEILKVLPVLTYSEAEVEKSTIDPSEELCEVLVQHMHSYAAMLNPELALSPSRDVSIFPDQYDVPDAHKHLYSSPEWTPRTWQMFKSYLSKPLSFELPVSKVSEILAAGQEGQREDFDDDVYICLSSPEEVPPPVGIESENESTVRKSVNVETVVDVAQEALTTVPENVSRDWLAECVRKDDEISDLTALIKKDLAGQKLLNLPIADDVPAELIFSITSAKPTVAEESLVGISTATKCSDLELSDLNSLNHGALGIVKRDCTEVSKLRKTKRRKRRGRFRRQKKASKAVIETPRVLTVERPVENDAAISQRDDVAKQSSGPSPLINSANIPWRKLRRRKRIYCKLSSKMKKLRSAAVNAASVSGPQSLESASSLELQVFPLRKKTERWDLKPVVSECGRILVPHGSSDYADHIKSLKHKLSKESTKDDPCVENMLSDASVNTFDTSASPQKLHDTVELEQESSSCPTTAGEKTESTNLKDGGNHFQDVANSPEHCFLRQSDDNPGLLPLNEESSQDSSKNDATDTGPLVAPNENQTETLSLGRCAAKGEFLLRKLKSVLLKGKRKRDVESEGISVNNIKEPELRVKKGKDNSELLKSNNAVTRVQEAKTDVREVSEVLSLDPIFAHALGLIPREKPDKIQKTEDLEALMKKDSSETQEPTVLKKQTKIPEAPRLNLARRKRIKTLKKRQGIPTEHIKKKWWLHFQTPGSFATEKLKCKEYTSDNSVRKNACSSTDALNLLADLALSARNGQVPTQPAPSFERKPETGLKNCDLTKDTTGADQESLLHALLRNPAATIKPLESSSSCHLVGGTELIEFISKEHAYSSPPSSSLLLGLPGTPFQVSPLSGSTRLLHHHQQLYGNRIQKQHLSLCHEDRGEGNSRTPEYLTKHVAHRHMFRHSRTFVNKDKSIQITRHWKDNYDFNLDSKFTNDPKDRTIVRALHGPWDCSIRDTSEEVQLIVHIWIGLFYSRSTARFFQIDSNFTYPCSDERDCLDAFTAMTSTPAQSELGANSSASSLIVTNTIDSFSITKALDLSKKDNYVLDQGAVDLSLRNSNGETHSSALQVNTIKYYKMVELPESIHKNDEATSRNEKEKMSAALQRAGCLEYTDGPPLKGNGSLIPHQEETKGVPIGPEDLVIASGNNRMLCGSNKEEAGPRDAIENSEGREISLTQKHETPSSKSVTNEEIESVNGMDEVPHTTEHKEMKSEDKTNSELKDNSYKQNNTEPPKEIDLCDDSTKEQLNIFSKGRCSVNGDGDLLSEETPETVPPAQVDSIDGDGDCFTAVEDQMISDEDELGKKDELDKKEDCISSLQTLNGLTAETSDRPDSVMDSITDRRHQSPYNDQLPQPDTENDACCYVQLGNPSGNGNVSTDEQSTSGESQPLSQMQPVYSEPLVEENDCLTDKETLPRYIESKCSQDESVPKTKAAELESKHTEKADFRFGSFSDQENKSGGAKNDDDTTRKESFRGQSQSHQVQIIKKVEAPAEDRKLDKTKEGLENSPRGIVIPFIGIDISGEDLFQLRVSHPHSKVEEPVQGQSKIPFSSATISPVLPTDGSASQVNGQNSELSANKTNQPLVFGSASDDRCPTPTLDEEPYNYTPYSDPANCKSTTAKCCSIKTTVVKDEIPQEQKHCHKSEVNRELSPHWGLHPDLKLRTLRVLQSIDKLFSTSNPNKKSNLMDVDTKECLNKTLNPNIKHTPNPLPPSCSSASFKSKKIRNTTSVVASASSSQLQTDSSGHFILSPFKRKLEEVLGVKLQLKETNSSVSHYFGTTETFQSAKEDLSSQSFASLPSQHFKALKPNIDYDRHKASQPSLNSENRSHSQRPVMAVKPSKSDDSQEDCVGKDGQVESFSTCKETSTPVDTSTTQTSRAKTDKTSVKGNSEGLTGDEHKASELSSQSDWLSSASDVKSNLAEIKLACLDPLYHYQRGDISNNTCASSSQSLRSNETTRDSCKFSGDGQKTKEKENCSGAFKSFMDYKNSNKMDDSLTLGPDTSLVCTVYNTGQKRKYSFLDHVSKRCIQDDLTQATLEWEHLVFYDQMKQLLKRSRRGPICQQGAEDKFKLSCSSPITVDFSSLEEQEDSMDPLDLAPLVQQKIKVDMSDRKEQARTNEKEKALDKKATGIPVEHAGVSNVAEECARLYEAKMNDACAVRKVPSRSKFARLDRGDPKTGPGNNFDFCDQMKREMDENFYSNLNSVVRKSRKTKYRFYILVTSDDGFFKETRAQLETQGHTAVQPSEFFLGEENSSLLIILKNEDIAEHICEVPHLLELKKASGVQFAGIDEPDDVINLTHQELFTRGGFLMFDRAALESLSLCDMKRCLDILQELCETGKWKWTLHYRDSRRLKEKARLSAEAKEKTHFLNWCQDSGIIEVLPYHECDLVSKDQPDYLVCLVSLQVQNISARYTLFITDAKPDSAFERNGILTMSVDTYLKMSPGEAFAV